MPYNYYITPEDYETAAINGVSYGLLNWRIRQANWEKKRAIETAPRKMKDRKRWVDIAAQNNISRPIFTNRIHKGWPSERAATQPVMTKEERVIWMRHNCPARCKYSKEIIEQAAGNGVSRSIFHKRVSLGWSLERAASEPLVSNEEKGRRGIKTAKRMYGDIHGLIFQKRG